MPFVVSFLVGAPEKGYGCCWCDEEDSVSEEEKIIFFPRVSNTGPTEMTGLISNPFQVLPPNTKPESPLQTRQMSTSSPVKIVSPFLVNKGRKNIF